MKSTYEIQAEKFAKDNGIKLAVVGDPEYRKYFPDDKESRYVFKMKLSRSGKSYTFNFGQSIASGAEEPTMYDILACLEKYDPENFDDFCANYGYNTDSRTAERTYKAVCKEYKVVMRLFSDIIDALREIN